MLCLLGTGRADVLKADSLVEHLEKYRSIQELHLTSRLRLHSAKEILVIQDTLNSALDRIAMRCVYMDGLVVWAMPE